MEILLNRMWHLCNRLEDRVFNHKLFLCSEKREKVSVGAGVCTSVLVCMQFKFVQKQICSNRSFFTSRRETIDYLCNMHDHEIIK